MDLLIATVGVSDQTVTRIASRQCDAASRGGVGVSDNEKGDDRGSDRVRRVWCGACLSVAASFWGPKLSHKN